MVQKGVTKMENAEQEPSTIPPAEALLKGGKLNPPDSTEQRAAEQKVQSLQDQLNDATKTLGDAVYKAWHGKPPPDPIVALEIKMKARDEIWIRETRWGSWLVWPVWFVGWVVGYAVLIISGLWYNVVRGYKRVRTTPLDRELD
jgi:hypothetical protein